MNIDNEKLEDIILKGNYLSEDEIKNARDVVQKNGKSLASYFIEEEILTKDLIGQAIAESIKVPYSDLNSYQPSKEQVLLIPEEIAKKNRCVIFEQSEDKKKITITTDSPKKELVQILSTIFPNTKISVTYSLSEDIDESLRNYRTSLDKRFSSIFESGIRIAPSILDEIFEEGYLAGASDIHFEPLHNEVVVRFRVDGVLREVGRIPKNYYENILNHIKVINKLRIDEHNTTQDGSFHYERGSTIFDVRTSIVPTVEGEKVVLRALVMYVGELSLENIGLSDENKNILMEVIKKPFGMILVTGPTGSGKTTTLYTILKLLNRPEVNITTIEDPVEYKIPGINQIQVNPQTNLTFAKGLRSIVRQDPDIILVGEIRDEETSEIAINAALTGHLLLSTFHANDASTAIPRLLDMKSEPFLLSSTLEVIIAQRLVRRICSSCRHSVSYSMKDINKKFPFSKDFFNGKSFTLYEGKGCNTCSQTGYHGRVAIFEFIKITPEIQDLVLTNPSGREIWKLAKKQGSKSLFEDGIEKVKNGTTTLEELSRVASPENTK